MHPNRRSEGAGDSDPRVLVLFAHPALHKSRANKTLTEIARSVEGVTVHDLYETYPDLQVDVEREQRLLATHDAIVAQFPFYWYSTPALLKQWQDAVLEFGWAYGPGGDALHGKTAICVTTTGGRDETYNATGSNRFTMQEFLRPLEQTFHLCGVEWWPPLVIHGAGRRAPDDLRAGPGKTYATLLEALRFGNRDPRSQSEVRDAR